MKKQNRICSCSKKTVYTLENVPIKFITKGTVTWTLTTPGETYSFSGDVTDKNLKFSFSLPDENVLLSIRYDNLEFEKCTENAQLVLTSGQRNVSGKHSVSIDNLSLKEVLSLNIDVVGEEVHPMILECTTKKDNQTIKLPLSGKSLNAQVDWGDGSPIQIIRNKYPTHEYAKSGVYEVMISGIVPRIDSFHLSIAEREYLTRIKSWGKLTGLISMNHAFCDCKNLRGELPNDDYGCFENVTDFSYCFGCCSGLTSIPEGLFVNCPNVIDFDFCFLDCSGLTSIPGNLFANCPNATSFNSCFNWCSGLTSIPEGLFVNCPNVTNFSGCFSNCRGLTGSIPDNLFANCPNVDNFGWCFMLCSGLTSIPENLFSNCPNVNDFSYCFYKCTGLTGTTPVDIMEDETRIELWERAGKLGYPNSIDGSDCFYKCPNLSNYSKIPSDWK